MKGLKYQILGLLFILIGGVFLIDTNSNLGGIGEVALFITGIYYGYKGLNIEE